MYNFFWSGCAILNGVHLIHPTSQFVMVIACALRVRIEDETGSRHVKGRQRLLLPACLLIKVVQQLGTFSPCTTEDTHHWRSKVGEDCSFLPALTFSPPSWLKWSSMHGPLPTATWSTGYRPLYWTMAELLVKEALHIQMIPTEECFNRDGGLEVPGC